MVAWGDRGACCGGCSGGVVLRWARGWGYYFSCVRLTGGCSSFFASFLFLFLREGRGLLWLLGGM